MKSTIDRFEQWQFMRIALSTIEVLFSFDGMYFKVIATVFCIEGGVLHIFSTSAEKLGAVCTPVQGYSCPEHRWHGIDFSLSKSLVCAILLAHNVHSSFEQEVQRCYNFQ